MTTYYKARQANQLAKYVAPSARELQAVADKRDMAEAAAHNVGVLIRKGRPVYYVTAPAYAESTDLRAFVGGAV